MIILGLIYNLAVIEDKLTYYLGSKSAARSCLPLVLEEECIGKTIVLYDDESHLADTYDGISECDEIGGTEGHKEVDFSSYDTAKSDWVNKNTLSEESFFELKKKFYLANSRKFKYLGNGRFENREGVTLEWSQ